MRPPGEEESTFIKVPIDELNTALMLYPTDGAWDGMGWHVREKAAIQEAQETTRHVLSLRQELKASKFLGAFRLAPLIL